MGNARKGSNEKVDALALRAQCIVLQLMASQREAIYLTRGSVFENFCGQALLWFATLSHSHDGTAPGN
jgi:hypothetical protein